MAISTASNGPHLVVVGQLRADKVGRDADDGADRKVDVACHHDQRLAHRHDGNDGGAGGDAVEEAG